MSTTLDPRLERAKEYLAIAESDDSKREAYIRAAEEVAAYKETTRKSNRDIAISLWPRQKKRTGEHPKEQTVQKLLQWRKTGYEAATPFLADGEATTRAARSHAKKLLSDPAEAAKLAPQILAALDTPEVMEAVEADDEATDHLMSAANRFGKFGREGKKVPRKRIRGMEEMLVTHELIAVLGKIRELAAEDASSPLISACKDLMRETLEILDGLAVANDPEEMDRLLSDFGDFLSSH